MLDNPKIWESSMSRKKRPFMPLYMADFLLDTGHLNAAETGAYLLLIMSYWMHGQLPVDDVKLARIARMTSVGSGLRERSSARMPS